MFKLKIEIYQESRYRTLKGTVNLFEDSKRMFEEYYKVEDNILESKVIEFLFQMGLIFGDEKIEFNWKENHNFNEERNILIYKNYLKIKLDTWILNWFRKCELNKKVIEQIKNIKKLYVSLPSKIIIENEDIIFKEYVEFTYDMSYYGKTELRYCSPINNNIKMI